MLHTSALTFSGVATGFEVMMGTGGLGTRGPGAEPR